MLNEILTTRNIVIFLFILTYLLIVLFYDKKTYIVWTSILIILLLKVISPFEALKAVNWNVIGIYVGMLFVSEMFIYSKIPDWIAEKLISRSSKVWVGMLSVCFFSGILSIVIENVAVVLIVAPVALLVSKKLKINPVPLIIGTAISSNLQGVATMIGDPPSLLVANYAKMNFNDFFIFQGKPGLFFAVQIGAIASLIVLYFIFKKYNMPSTKIKIDKVKSYFPGIILITMIIALAIASVFEYHGNIKIFFILNQYKLGLICLISGLVAWIWYYGKERKDFYEMPKRLDWETGFFLIGIFILVESLIKVDFMALIAGNIGKITGTNVFLAFNIIIWTSVIFSAFIDNVPFIAAMLPVVGHLAEIMNISPYLLYFGLVIGASVGGNITPVGASANIVGMGILKKEGHKVNFWEFVKIGLPFTIVSVLSSTIFIWIIFS